MIFTFLLFAQNFYVILDLWSFKPFFFKRKHINLTRVAEQEQKIYFLLENKTHR